MLQRRLHFPPFPPERPPKCHMTPKIGLSAQVNWAEAHVYGEEGKQDTFISSPPAKLFYFFTFFNFWPCFLALWCSKWFTKALLPIFHPTILLFNSPKHPNPPPMLAILSPYSHINTPWVQFLLPMLQADSNYYLWPVLGRYCTDPHVSHFKMIRNFKSFPMHISLFLCVARTPRTGLASHSLHWHLLHKILSDLRWTLSLPDALINESMDDPAGALGFALLWIDFGDCQTANRHHNDMRIIML